MPAGGYSEKLTCFPVHSFESSSVKKPIIWKRSRSAAKRKAFQYAWTFPSAVWIEKLENECRVWSIKLHHAFHWRIFTGCGIKNLQIKFESFEKILSTCFTKYKPLPLNYGTCSHQKIKSNGQSFPELDLFVYKQVAQTFPHQATKNRRWEAKNSVSLRSRASEWKSRVDLWSRSSLKYGRTSAMAPVIGLMWFYFLVPGASFV